MSERSKYWCDVCETVVYTGDDALAVHSCYDAKALREQQERERALTVAERKELATLRTALADAQRERDEAVDALDTWAYEVGKVYCHITGNRLSKASYLASTVISEADDETQKIVEEETATLRAELDSAERARNAMAKVVEAAVSYCQPPADDPWANAKRHRDLSNAVQDFVDAKARAAQPGNGGGE